jgi:hypothetical protein
LDLLCPLVPHRNPAMTDAARTQLGPGPYERLAPVADAFGAPGLRDQDRIGGPGTAGRSQPGVATHRRNSLGWGRRTDVWASCT